jgi:predicted homoserine dehydrogenase-like protein
VPDLRPELGAARAARGSAPCPYYLAVGRTLARPVPAGSLITVDSVAMSGSSALAALRAEQDRMFALAD